MTQGRGVKPLPGGKYLKASWAVAGAVLMMEWNDEWWKGAFPDVRSKGCPNPRSDRHTYCGST